MDVFIGIDPSINSTGICIKKYKDNKLYKTQFFNIKSKLTKKEESINIKNFKFVLYNKLDIQEYKEDNHQHEYYKTVNLIDVVDKIWEVIKKNITSKDNVTIAMEGISYGSSIRTKSIYDLAGLNYLIRLYIIKNGHINLCICPPSEIKKFASGKGNSQKDILVEAFLILFPNLSELKKVDDIADAYFMCEYAIRLSSN